ncbi:MAG TPA: hypothetical protein PKB13_11510 [Clostridia bacterium]|nr:hypothetical protein [Clostridia bacterium]
MNMKLIGNPTQEELEIHHLRLDLSSIRESGRNMEFARKYLIDRFVNIGTYMTAETFDRVLNEAYVVGGR